MEDKADKKLELMREQEWFNNLIDDCQRIVLNIKHKGWEIIKEYHALGKRITEDREKFIEHGDSNKQMVDRIAEQISRSSDTVYRAIRFYEFYPDLELSPFTEDSQWFQVTKELAKLEAKKKEKIKGTEETKAKPTLDNKKEEAQKDDTPKKPEVKFTLTRDKKWLMEMDPTDMENIDFSKVHRLLSEWLATH